MQKFKKKKKTVNVIEFYCDDCGKFLGQSEEYDDGYIPEIGEYKEEFYLHEFNGWYRINKTLCDECKDKLLAKIDAELRNLGFKPDKEQTY